MNIWIGVIFVIVGMALGAFIVLGWLVRQWDKSNPWGYRSAMQWERGVREGEAIAFRRAAQMLEEKLNG